MSHPAQQLISFVLKIVHPRAMVELEIPWVSTFIFLYLAFGYNLRIFKVLLLYRTSANKAGGIEHQTLPILSFYPPLTLSTLCVCVCVWGWNSWPTSWVTLPAPPPPFFLMGVFKIESHRTVCLGWPQTSILLVFASWVTRIIGMSHRHLAALHFYDDTNITLYTLWQKWKLHTQV
jgi:hypothetical protein